VQNQERAMNKQRIFQTTLLVAGVACAGNVFATDWLQFGYDPAHSSSNTAEHGYSTMTGNSIVRHYNLPSSADSAPIYLANVATASGNKNLLFVGTKNGTLLALDADAASATVIWSKQTNGGGTLSTGSPVVDPNLQYVYAYAHDGMVHKYQVGDGTEVMVGGWPETSTLKPSVEKGAAALSIASPPGGTNYLYSVTDGYIGDGGDYQGHITTINMTTGSQNVFNSECSNLTIHFVLNGATSGAGQNDCTSKQNGIWGRPGAIYDAGTNRVFISTGNGPYNASTGGLNWGDSVLALHADGTGAGAGMPVDSYTPTTFQQLQNTDADLGSVSLALVPAPPGTAAQYQHIGVHAGGKDGCVRLINLADMSGNAAPAHTGGELQAVNVPGGSNCASGNDGPEIKPQPAVWVNPVDSSSWVFVVHGGGAVAYKVALDGAGKPSLAQQWTGSSGTSPVVANGTVYYMSSSHMRALDAVSGTSMLSASNTWLTTSNGGQHWQSPILVNGRLYAIDNGNPSQLWIYQLDGAFKNGFE
jgi:hypothetical protein